MLHLRPTCFPSVVAAIAVLGASLLLGCKSTSTSATPPDEFPIKVESAPASRTLDGSVTGRAPLHVEFTAPVFEGYTYVWDFGTGETANGRVATYTYQAAGVYQATCQLLDAEGAAAVRSTRVVVQVGDSTPVAAVDTFSEALTHITQNFVGALTRFVDGHRTGMESTAIGVPQVQLLTAGVPDKDTSPSGWVTKQIVSRHGELIVQPAGQLLDALKSATVNDAGVGIVERDELDRIVEELLLAFDDEFNEDTASRIGSLANANAFVFVQVQPTFTILRPKSPLSVNTWWIVKGVYTAKARLVDSTSGTAVWYNTVTWEREFDVRRN